MAAQCHFSSHAFRDWQAESAGTVGAGPIIGQVDWLRYAIGRAARSAADGDMKQWYPGGSEQPQFLSDERFAPVGKCSCDVEDH